MPKKKPVLGIIDAETKGNVVRFYIGDINANYCGDDWDDRPYEDNAGTVYSNFVDHTIDVAFPFDADVFEPNTGRYCKNDIKNRMAPCIIIVPSSAKEYRWQYRPLEDWIASDKTQKFYFGDTIDEETFKNAPECLTITKTIKTKITLN